MLVITASDSVKSGAANAGTNVVMNADTSVANGAGIIAITTVGNRLQAEVISR